MKQFLIGAAGIFGGVMLGLLVTPPMMWVMGYWFRWWLG